MEIFSAQELAFLRYPDKFSRNYQKVLRCRIRKKARAMWTALLIIEYSPKAMQSNGSFEELPLALLN